MSQILQTVDNITDPVILELVMPYYHEILDLETIKRNNGLKKEPRVMFLKNFGIQSSGTMALILFNLPAIFFLLTKKIKKEVEFIYIRSNLFLPLAFSAYLLRVPIFLEIHRNPLSFGESIRDKAMSRIVTGMIVISDYLRVHYLSYGKKILVAHDAVSLERFGRTLGKEEARKKLGLALKKKISVYAGTVRKLKGVDYLVEAAKRLPEVDFLLVGPVSEEFQNQSFPSNIKLLGKKDQEDIPSLLQAADVLLLPHPKSEYSQSPMKLFEYMASGVPIVASRLPSISEVLNDRNAILVEAENGKALANGIAKAINDIKLSQTLAQQAYNDVQNYTWEKRGIAIAEFIKENI
ncbi:MAG: glycosyltransferase family 4 protein [Candidatus Zambryskibacteria bacterium]|nr:glycosyltransferase family 4 protein [Candidatus Zambryskibacteria bacterium]